MDIAIIGGGFTGLTAGYELSGKGHRVTVFERQSYLGGLAYGFTEPEWDWHIEGAYHHLFTNDRAILTLIRDLNIEDRLLTIRPVTATLWNGGMYQLDSAYHLLRFPGLSPLDRIRTGMAIGMAKMNPFWEPLEAVTAESLMRTLGGEQGWNVIWQPLLYGKFGTLAPSVSAAWLWARIVKRTPSLCYPEGGFHTLVLALAAAIAKRGGTVVTGKPVQEILKTDNTYMIGTKRFDRVLLTVPTPLAARIAPILPKSYLRPLEGIRHLSAQTLILETDRPVLERIYWLNVTDRSFPFLAAVAHTNFVDASHYGGRHLTYFGNYLPPDHPYLSMTAKQLTNKFLPFIRKLVPSRSNAFRILRAHTFVGPYAQPVHTIGYSSRIPPLSTPIPGLYMANMDYVVPWDRGTNYAVDLGLRAARLIHETH